MTRHDRRTGTEPGAEREAEAGRGAAGQKRAPEPWLRVEYDITVVGGEQGRRLAALQARAVLDVLAWFHHADESRQP